MSYGKPPAQVLRAPTIEAGLMDHAEQASLVNDELIELLNERFPKGLESRMAALLLPNEIDMARAAITHQQVSMGSFCLERYSGEIFSDSKLINPAVDKYSLLRFCHEEESWYRVTPEHIEAELVS